MSGRIGTVVGRAILIPVRLYQRWISPALPPCCRYYPSCSAYAVEAVGRHGPLKGVLLSVWRVLRCNPMSPGGVDHVPDRGRWRYHYPHDIARFTIR